MKARRKPNSPLHRTQTRKGGPASKVLLRSGALRKNVLGPMNGGVRLFGERQMRPYCRFCIPILVMVLVVNGCYQKGQSDAVIMDLQDPRLSPFSSMYGEDREKYHLVPLATSGKVKLWLHNRDRSSAAEILVMGSPSKMLFFANHGQAYALTAEFDRYLGPRTYSPGERTRHEAITISYDYLSSECHISYSGPDEELSALSRDEQLTLTKIEPILSQWGYKIGRKA